MDSYVTSSFISQLKSIKLNHDNYLTWKHQIVPLIRSIDLYGHLDGTSPAPPAMILQEYTGEDEKVAHMEIHNPDYDSWMQKDQLLVFFIISTLSHEVLVSISDDLQAAELWNMLAHTYSQVSEFKIFQLKRQFLNMRRGTKRIMEFLADVKGVTDELASMGCPVSDRDKVQLVLSGLGPEFRMFCTVVQVLPTLPSFEDLQTKLLQYEINQQHTSNSMQEGKDILPSHVAMMGTRGQRVPTCFLCNKRGHIKANCWFNPQNRNRGGRQDNGQGQFRGGG